MNRDEAFEELNKLIIDRYEHSKWMIEYGATIKEIPHYEKVKKIMGELQKYLVENLK